MLDQFAIAEFQQVSIDGNRLEFEIPLDSALRKLAETRNLRTDTMQNHTLSFSIVSVEFQQYSNDIFHPEKNM